MRVLSHLDNIFTFQQLSHDVFMSYSKMSVHVFFIVLIVNDILAIIPDEDTPILTEFEPSDWVIKNFGAYLAIKRNNSATDIIG